MSTARRRAGSITRWVAAALVAGVMMMPSPRVLAAPAVDAPAPDAPGEVGETDVPAQDDAAQPDPPAPTGPVDAPAETRPAPVGPVEAPSEDAPTPEPAPEPQTKPTETSAPAAAKEPRRPARVPPPSTVRRLPTRVAVGVGLSPEAPGTKKEKALLDGLEKSLAASKKPIPDLRHVSAGTGDPRSICRERRDDLVVMIGYLPERADPVVLTHDCRLDRPLGVRSAAAVSQPGLLGALWKEHEDLIRQGVRERRTIRRLSPTARGVIIASVAVAVVGVAVGILVANALRDERVVITVSP